MAATGPVSVGISLGSESATLAIAPATQRDANGTIISDLTGLARPTVIAAEDGERSTPAFGAWVDSELLVGATAKNAVLRQPQRTVSCLAPLLSKVKEFQTLAHAKVEYLTPEAMLTTLEEEDGEFIAHPVSEILLAFLALLSKLTNGAAGPNPVASVTVAVPRYVDAAAVLALMQKAEFPKGAILDVMYDDAAAMLANGIGAPTWSPKVYHNACLVVDVGHTATQVSVLTCGGGAMTLVATDFITGASGRLVDEAMSKQMVETFIKRKCRSNPGEEVTTGRPYRKLLVAADRVKKTLTSSQTANCEVEAFFDGMDLTDNINRAKLDKCLTQELSFFKDIEALMEKVLGQAAETSETLAISHVVFHGGVCRIPAVQAGLKARVLEVIESVIENDDQLDMLDDELVTILDAIPGDEAAALGATVQASLAANGCAAETKAGQIKRDALTFDIGFWAGAEAPKVDGGKCVLPENNKDDDEDEDEGPREMEPMFTLAIQKGSPCPTELVVEVPTETSLLPLARTAFKEYVPLCNSVTVPKTATDKQTLHILLKADGELTITPVPTGEAFAAVDPMCKCKIF